MVAFRADTLRQKVRANQTSGAILTELKTRVWQTGCATRGDKFDPTLGTDTAAHVIYILNTTEMKSQGRHKKLLLDQSLWDKH